MLLRPTNWLYLSKNALQAGFDYVRVESNGDIYVSARHDSCESQLDITFLLDTSGSMSRNDFQASKNFAKSVSVGICVEGTCPLS